MSSDDARQLRLERSVLESNYSFLVEALVPEDIVPELFTQKLITKSQKEKADSHPQKYAKNVAIMDSLLGRAEVGAFHRFCDVLSSTSGQEYIADKLTACFQPLMRGETQQSPTPSNSHSTTNANDAGIFSQLLIDLVKMLEGKPGVLVKMQLVLESMALSYGGKLALIVESVKYKEAKTVAEFFRSMTSYWNHISHYLLRSVVAASECTEAIQRLDKYLASKDPSAVVIPPPLSSDSSTSDSMTSVDGPPVPVSGLTPGASHVPAKTGQNPSRTISISADIECSKLTAEEYDQVHHYISSLMRLPAVALRYDNHQEQCSIRLFWLISGELASYTQAALGDTTTPQLGILRCLVNCYIKEISIGNRSYKLPTHLEMSYLEAAWDGSVERVSDALRAGVHADTTMPISVSALMWASLWGHLQVVERILAAGAEPNLQDNGGWTAMMFASQEGQEHVVEALLKCRATVDIQNEENVTALMIAVYHGHLHIVEVLIRFKSDVNLQTKGGETALTFACKKEGLRSVELLLKASADPNHKTMDGQTPLLIATRKGSRMIVAALLEADANPNFVLQDGLTPLMLASDEGNIEMVDLLLQYSADPNLQQPQTGHTALMLAAKAGYLNLVKNLITSGARLDMTNQHGMTAADMASISEQPDVYQELVEASFIFSTIMQSESGGQAETVQADQQLPQSEEEGDLLGKLLRALVLKLDRDSELMKALHTELRPQETRTRKGIQEVTEHCFEEND